MGSPTKEETWPAPSLEELRGWGEGLDRRIESVKAYRVRTRLGLREAMAAFRTAWAQDRPEERAAMRTAWAQVARLAGRYWSRKWYRAAAELYALAVRLRNEAHT